MSKRPQRTIVPPSKYDDYTQFSSSSEDYNVLPLRSKPTMTESLTILQSALNVVRNDSTCPAITSPNLLTMPVFSTSQSFDGQGCIMGNAQSSQIEQSYTSTLDGERSRHLEPQQQEAKLAELERSEIERNRLADQQRVEAERQQRAELERSEIERNRLVDQQRVEAKCQQRAELERSEIEKNRLADQERVEAERQQRVEQERAEIERHHLADQQRVETERQQREEQERAEIERIRLADQQRIEAERQQRVEQERAEIERNRVVAQQRTETERQQRAEQERAEIERNRLVAQQRLEVERQQRAQQQRAEIERHKLAEQQRIERSLLGEEHQEYVPNIANVNTYRDVGNDYGLGIIGDRLDFAPGPHDASIIQLLQVIRDEQRKHHEFYLNDFRKLERSVAKLTKSVERDSEFPSKPDSLSIRMRHDIEQFEAVSDEEYKQVIAYLADLGGYNINETANLIVKGGESGLKN